MRRRHLPLTATALPQAAAAALRPGGPEGFVLLRADQARRLGQAAPIR